MGIEILLVMKLEEQVYNQKAMILGVGSALMIVSGYYGELVVTGDLTPRWAVSSNEQRSRPRHQGKNQDGPGHDRDQLVHLSNRLLVPHAWHQRGESSGVHSSWLLRFGHHFQVWGWPCDLPNHLRQIEQSHAFALDVGLKASCVCKSIHIVSRLFEMVHFSSFAGIAS